MFIQINPNPLQKSTGDCVIRAISILFNKSWDEIYIMLSLYGFMLKDWGNSIPVWERYLFDQGFRKGVVPNSCPNCYTVKEFCLDAPMGDFLLCSGNHTVAVRDKNYWDSWDSGNEIISAYYWKDIDIFTNEN